MASSTSAIINKTKQVQVRNNLTGDAHTVEDLPDDADGATSEHEKSQSSASNTPQREVSYEDEQRPVDSLVCSNDVGSDDEEVSSVEQNDDEEVSGVEQNPAAATPRRGARIRRPPERYGAQVVSVNTERKRDEWKDKFDYLWETFPGRRDEIYLSLLHDCKFT